MKFGIKRLKEVEEDQLAAACWYDEQHPGLGDDFLDESESIISGLCENALLYSVRFADVRCVRLRRFKRFGVYYIVSGREVILLAIHHGSRDQRWLDERRNKLNL
jgi:hypothetical protein